MLVKITPTKKIEGQIKIGGSKNSCLAILAISLLTSKKIVLKNVPLISDIFDMIEILKSLGVKVKIDFANNKITLKRKRMKNPLLIEEASKIRASYYVIPGMVKRFKKIKIKYPGGCNFSKRPIDYHLDALKKSGAVVETIDDYIIIKRKKLKNAIYSFPKPSVGATINAIMLSVLTKKTSKIINQVIEPEIKDFINCLNKMGANIIIKNSEIIIKGVRKLKATEYKIMPDRIEVGSFILLASCLNSNLLLTNVNQESILYLLPYLNKLGINLVINDSTIKIENNTPINNINLIIKEYPSFPTDLQQIICACLLTSTSNSIIEDRVYPERISHIKELLKMHANINYLNNLIYIYPSSLIGSYIYAHDLRCGFALIIASVIASSPSYIDNFQIIYRGYENIISKLRSINIKIEILIK